MPYFIFSRSGFARATVILMLLAVAADDVFAWWAAEWTQRKPLSVDTTATGANITALVNDAPILVRLHAGNFPQFLNVRDGGVDFRFIGGDDQTPLKYHVEKFDAAAQIALVWVRLPAVNPQSTENPWYLYFGNQAAVNGADAGATYDADMATVMHFSGSNVLADSTAYQTVASGQALANPASIIGDGALLPGTGALTLADSPHLAFTAEKGFTIALWARVDALPEATAYLLDRVGSGARVSITLNGGELAAEVGGTRAVSSAPVAAGQWHHIALSVAAGSMRLFLDGAEVGTVAVAAPAADGPIMIGSGADGTGAIAIALDELQISTVGRSADALRLAATVQGPANDRAMTYGRDEAADAAGDDGGEGAAHGGHFNIIIQNVFGKEEAIVEQIVIGLCGVMMMIAILVMFLKAVALSRARGATNRFLKAYAALSPTADDPNSGFESLFDRTKTFRDSPLFRVYRRGLEEVRTRTSAAVGAAPSGLDDKALNSLRASLDATMVREGQKLNSQLVLLTIAISGGPFIGLLGTVVGVMVTFAAIAATGDVNIAAIAPGMAAALLATVAGLGVAIPALFGYNYLGSKAKDISADMHVFADEFEARVNEYYGA